MNNKKIIITQILLILIFIILWQLLVDLNIINSFLYSSPKMIIKTIINLLENKMLFSNIHTTLREVIISATLSLIISFIISIILWWNKTIYKIIDPFLSILNSLPKVSFGPLIILWFGANTKSIIIMSLLISSIITIINLINAFNNTNNELLTLFKTFNANKITILKKLIIPSNYNNILNTIKINISMTLIGIITGELLVSKSGIGYLIMYGSQVFNISLIISSIIILIIISYIIFKLIKIII